MRNQWRELSVLKQNFLIQIRHFTTNHPKNHFLTKPNWSVKFLLPSTATSNDTIIDDKALSHLLRLSSLRMPSDDAAKKRLVSDINTLCNFVKHIQEVDVENVEPLRSIWPRNIGLMMREDIEKEDVSGEELLKCAERTHGKFHVVDNPKTS